MTFQMWLFLHYKEKKKRFICSLFLHWKQMLLTTQKIKLMKRWLVGSVFGWCGCQQWAHSCPLTVPSSHLGVPCSPGCDTSQCWPHLQPGLVLRRLLPDPWVAFSVVSPVVFLQPIWSGGEFGPLTKACRMYLKLSATILHLPFGRIFYKTSAFPQPCSSWKPPSPTNTLGWLGSWSFSFPNEGSGRRRDCPPESAWWWFLPLGEP